MTVDEMLDRFRIRLGELRERSACLSAALREVSRSLTDSGCPPSEGVIDRLRTFRAEFRELKAQLQAGGDGASLGESDHSVTSLFEMERELDARFCVRQALALLDRLDAIRPVDRRDVAPWQRCLADGQALRRALMTVVVPQARIEATRLLSLEHPLSALVALVSDGDEFTDERWCALLEVVTSAYGKEVSTAVARRRLLLSSAALPVSADRS